MLQVCFVVKATQVKSGMQVWYFLHWAIATIIIPVKDPSISCSIGLKLIELVDN